MNARRILSVLGLALSLGVALLGPLWAAGAAEIVDMPFAPSSWARPLGTDHYGFDVVPRVLAGGWRIVVVSAAVVAVAYVLGLAAGMLAALRGGWTDSVTLRAVDVLMGMPALVLLTVVITGTGQGLVGVGLATVVVLLPDLVRIVRAATGEILGHDYVEVALARGESTLSVLVREVLPNLIHVVIADLAVRWVAAAYTVATASFLGFGTRPPAADWGLMVYENRDGLGLQPLAVAVPAGALLVLLLSATTLLDDLATGRDVPPPARRKRLVAGRAVAEPDGVAQADELRVVAGGQTILDGVSVTVRRGQVVALVGPSGSGKTTTALALLGHCRPGMRVHGGSVWLAGNRLDGLSERRLRRLRSAHAAYVAQDPRTALAAHIRVGDQIAEMLRARGVPRAEWARRIPEALGAVGLPVDQAFLRRWPHELSGGQRQRIALAAALAHRPALLVLDEPTSAVDLATATALLDDLDRLRQEYGLAVLLVSHDVYAVSRIADRVVVLDSGAVVREGPPELVLPAPETLTASTSSRTDEPPLLVARELTFDRATPVGRVLHGVDLHVAPGGSISVLGESGCGKTTLLRCLAGLLHPRAGSMRLGADALAPAVRNRTGEQRRRLALVPQNPYDSLNPRHTVGQIVGRPLRQFGLAGSDAVRDRVAELLADVDLPADMLDRRPGELSGGQRQRVALARALATQPDVLLCDEVTSGLDPRTATGVVDLLCHLRDDRGIALVVVTHDSSLAARLGGDVLILRDGHVVEHGPAERILTDPADRYTSTLLAASARVQAAS
jgi:ABC-type glutathione transport system ATPase component/ABC-type dipeptide/oligopeptide/nickel transport system permease subunit